MPHTTYIEYCLVIPDNFPEFTQDHLERLLYEILEETANKYIKGQLEHGGDLRDKTVLELLNEAINENIDQAVYLRTLKEKLEKLEKFRITCQCDPTQTCEICRNSKIRY